jgi:transcription elongation factor Elf1
MENQIDYDDFITSYEIKHKYCPICGEESHTETLEGFIVDYTNLDKYKDKNICVCLNCGNKHTVHDRIDVEERIKLLHNK